MVFVVVSVWRGRGRSGYMGLLVGTSPACSGRANVNPWSVVMVDACKNVEPALRLCYFTINVIGWVIGLIECVRRRLVCWVRWPVHWFIGVLISRLVDWLRTTSEHY